MSTTPRLRGRTSARSLKARSRNARWWVGIRGAAALWALMGGSPADTRLAHAEPPQFTAEVEHDQVPVGASFVYQVTLSVGRDEVSDYRPPDFKGLRVLNTPAAPNQSTQMQFGGAGMFVQMSYSWRYELAVPRSGRVTIGPARIRVNGQEFRSSSVTVTATGTGAAVPPPPLASAPSAASGPSSGDPSIPSEAAEGGSFIRVVTNKQKVFVGEPITATWYLYMGQPADKYDTQVEPHTEGFWTEDVTVPSRRGGLVLTQESVQGRPYQVGTVLKKALFPLQIGRLTITPMEAEISRSDFFGNAVRTQRVRSGPTDIEVLPLPKAGQPAGFDAANVGSFTLNVRADRTQVAVGEPVTLTIEVAGRGNLRKLALPNVPKIPGWKAYDPRVNVVIDPASGVTGTKTAEILLLPERPGAVTLPPLVLDTFDPESHRYARAETSAIPLTATGDATAASRSSVGGVGGLGTAPARGGSLSENVISEEIRPLHARASLRRELGTTFFRTRLFAVALAVPPVGLLLAIGMLRVRARLDNDSGARRRRHARRKVRAHLAAADGHRQRGELGPFFIEIDRVIRETLAGRLGRSVKGLRMDEVGGLLRSRGLPPAEVERVIALLEECDRGRFAPISSNDEGAAALTKIQDSASDLIDVIEKAPLSSEGQA